MNLKYKPWCIALFLLLCGAGYLRAQDVTVRSGFFKDSLRVGDVTGYYLTARYPSKLNILFPDSAFNFAPFEYDHKKYFPTETEGGKSYDSVVYYLSTFEIDRLQTLSLPVFQLNPRDCVTYASASDTILFTSLVPELPDTLSIQNLPLKVSIAHQDVPKAFNYVVLLIVVGVLLVLSVIGWFVFGKRILKHYRLKRLQQAHQKFLEAYTPHVDALRATFSAPTTERALSQWKKYMEQLEARPFTKLTTREIARLENNEALGKTLHAVDGAIYGHDTAVVDSLETLKTIAGQRFSKKLEEVKHG
ncbi:hypothetical protein [Chryseolinea soli]|uniref:DUF4381 domain-containing protein n=1 Tax=Chryseolinea soli TaxID=2321403 RepID=A0A385SMN6_9BACT|nr:hypothetical protein [Chryseolinea soli]AYB32264.1 hypothetical protein D4L85_17540 [Chryseolinea soli]